jgi:cell division protein FtsW (lipid II flippase)
VKLNLFSPLIWLSLSVLLGIYNMANAGAPLIYVAVNAGAMLLAVSLIVFVPVIKAERVTLILCACAVAALGLPLVIGADLDGVRRWIGVGPVQFHSAMLVLPTLVALSPRLKPAHGVAAAAFASIAISLQPDRASAIALLAGTAALLIVNRSPTHTIQLLFAGFAVAATFMLPDSLEPAAYVENILPDAWRNSPILAIVLAASLAAALIIPAICDQRLFPLTATIGGFAVASLMGTYPVPLLGYGAAAIIGYGLAVAAARQPVP